MSIIKPISRRVGDYQVTALSDGNMSVSLGILSGIDPADADERQRAAGVADPQALHINAYLIRGRGRTILVDSGTGGRNNAGGQLPARLRQMGIAPAVVDTVDAPENLNLEPNASVREPVPSCLMRQL